MLILILRIILIMDSDIKSLDEKSHKVQHFYRLARHHLERLPEWEPSQVDTLSEAIEQFLMLKFHEKYVYCHVCVCVCYLL